MVSVFTAMLLPCKGGCSVATSLFSLACGGGREVVSRNQCRFHRVFSPGFRHKGYPQGAFCNCGHCVSNMTRCMHCIHTLTRAKSNKGNGYEKMPKGTCGGV